jgi:hypothetical protein
MMAVLYMVGDGLEEPLQAKRLLDLELFPKKPHFAKVHNSCHAHIPCMHAVSYSVRVCMLVHVHLYN